MKYLLISFALCTLLFIGCNKEECDPITPPVDNSIPFEINFLQYSDNNYFIDNVYTDTTATFNIYNLFYGSVTPMLLPKYYIKEIEVYQSINRIDQGQNSIEATAHINLPPRQTGTMYPDSLRYQNIIVAGETEATRFRLLNEGSDYLFHTETGYITLINPLTGQDVIAVAYKIENNLGTEDDLTYGEFIAELVNNSKTRGVLKLVKPTYLKPQYEAAWNLKMKNIYQVAPNLGQIKITELDIYLKKNDGSESNTINNIRLLELFGLDRYDENAMPVPDGKFDNRAYLNFEPRTSEIIFPVIQPFGSNIPFSLKEYKYQEIYDTIKSYLTLPGNNFVIKGKYVGL